MQNDGGGAPFAKQAGLICQSDNQLGFLYIFSFYHRKEQKSYKPQFMEVRLGTVLLSELSGIAAGNSRGPRATVPTTLQQDVRVHCPVTLAYLPHGTKLELFITLTETGMWSEVLSET